MQPIAACRTSLGMGKGLTTPTSIFHSVRRNDLKTKIYANEIKELQG
jgi:hypothetical protein